MVRSNTFSGFTKFPSLSLNIPSRLLPEFRRNSARKIVVLGWKSAISWRELRQQLRKRRRRSKVPVTIQPSRGGRLCPGRADPERLRDTSPQNQLQDLYRAREALIMGTQTESTWKQYDYAFKRFTLWAGQVGATLLPCSEEIAQLYIGFIA